MLRIIVIYEIIITMGKTKTANYLEPAKCLRIGKTLIIYKQSGKIIWSSKNNIKIGPQQNETLKDDDVDQNPTFLNKVMKIM